jgi:DNA-binding response OmpR family regulator
VDAEIGAMIDLRGLGKGEIVDIQSAHDGRKLVVMLPSDEPAGAATRNGLPADRSCGDRKTISHALRLEHDPLGQIFFLAGEELRLPPQEYRLLHFLAEHPRHLLTGQQLLDGAWGAQWEGDFGALHTCICRLRRRVGKAGQLIQARRGFGYRFVPEPSATPLPR